MNTLEFPKLITSRIILLDAYDQVVVEQRRFTAGQRAAQLDFFGGRVDLGEDPIEGAVRELNEEGGLEVDVADVVELAAFHEKRDGRAITRHYALYPLERHEAYKMTEHIGAPLLPVMVAESLMPLASDRLALALAASL